MKTGKYICCINSFQHKPNSTQLNSTLL